MNHIHRWLCRSPLWQRALKQTVMPWALNAVELGDNALEVGPGPGLATDLLRLGAAHLTAIEIDAPLAASLASRLRGTNVAVIPGDATRMPFENARFTGAVSLVMLHHVPSPKLQNDLVREVYRVLRPGGVFAGMDVRQSLAMRLIHFSDTLVPVEPDTFAGWLQAAGFRDVLIDANPYAFRFRARRPLESR
ncbi:MAG TPA: class I SAM-dependent methyltransferase [Terriglobia bacterium]|nr:class I SAM-dependent methyltransferase [Terriglobia bacterium]